MAIAGARRLAAAGAVTAFVVGGVGMAAGVGTAIAQTSRSGGPAAAATCEGGLPCESASGDFTPGDAPGLDGGADDDPWADGGSGDSPSSPGESSSGEPSSADPGDGSWSEEPSSDESFASIPLPGESGSKESWSAAPGESFSSGPASLPASPWEPAEHKKRKVPVGAPQTGAGGLAADSATWPFAVGGAALTVGAGLAGYAVRRRRAGEA
ncbi:hypothetical protein [Planobispora longispora]|uniref:Uncharacterized protein n=1 Tax=Planobispora longispora TaxID=28887 RepID=A0A8J3RHV3_9ACTN|nr:hypothetical protein [Planobispora longispora]GIH76661.1 hypothetical protein Plo01_30900 [Planobispora longispora]